MDTTYPKIETLFKREAVSAVKGGVKSLVGPIFAEGLVVRPMVDLRCRNGQRVIGKIKTKDFIAARSKSK